MTDVWGPEDWQVYFDERASTTEYDGKLPRPDAEARAFACCVAEWLIRQPVASPQGCCPSSGVADRPGDLVLGPWHAARRAEAAAALRAMGIDPGAAAGEAA
jgi:hypothetical protein